ncbi:DNA mismatch repair protein MutS [Nanoarchaeota archaeon]
MKLTPGMQQYINIKNQHPDALVLFRMGDFYETFYEDAKTAARELNITLTARGKGDTRAPLAGIPYHALDQYLAKLVKKGYKVAIVEQLEDPKKAKGIVKRGVVRIVTPGTVMESYILNEKANNFIMSLSKDNDRYGISLADISTGDFMTTIVMGWDKLVTEITRFNPSEIIIPLSQEHNENLKQLKKQTILTIFDDRHFWKQNAYDVLIGHFKVLNLEGFGIEKDELAINASGALLSYLKETQKTTLGHINKLKKFSVNDYMLLDSSTQRNLELTKNIKDSTSRGTLLETLDNTTTSMGSRLLKIWLQRPLLNLNKINSRQDAIAELCSSIIIREDIRAQLSNISDIERLISRISYGSANARDLVALRNSLKIIPKFKEILDGNSSELLRQIGGMDDVANIVELISGSIREEPPLTVRDGNMIKTGYNEQLDKLHEIKSGGKSWIAKLELKEKGRTGIKSLKIKFNKVFGYFIEITKANLHMVPKEYIRKQTQVNAERFITEELKEQESLILGAEDKIHALEYELFVEILNIITKDTVKIQDVAKNVALLDTLTSLAHVAAENNYVRPIVDDSNELFIKDGRHPVVEKIEDFFIPNDVVLNNESHMGIITGPNMAGKSTYMRQVALITLMAQIGSFVPASEAKVGVVDRIFTRVGAYDDLTMGQSTFMVEMTETANILNNATDKSLVILDEIGRGTSTFDGISIAWSVAEYISKSIKAKTLFATHYHQLNNLSEHISGVKNYNIAVKEKDDHIVFLRKIVEGGTDKSYGIQVAKLAGLPSEVIERSKVIMDKLEMEDKISDKIHKTQEDLQSSLVDKDKHCQQIKEDKKINIRQLSLNDL